MVNLWSGDREYSVCFERIAKVFDGGVARLPTGGPGNIVARLPTGTPSNIVVMGFKRSPGQPAWADLRRRAQALEIATGLEFERFVQELTIMNPHDRDRLLI